MVSKTKEDMEKSKCVGFNLCHKLFFRTPQCTFKLTPAPSVCPFLALTLSEVSHIENDRV